MTMLAETGAPYCFDEPSDWRPDDTLAEMCEACPLDYQAAMLLARRCFPPEPDVTPVARIRASVPDVANLRAILEQARIGHLSEQLEPWFRRT